MRGDLRGGPIRRGTRAATGLLALATLAWSGWLFLADYLDAPVFGRHVTATGPLRPLLAGAVALAIFILAGGDFIRPVRVVGSVFRRPVFVALCLTAITTFMGLAFGVRSAGGADTYGYISQADLWLSGQLRIEQPFMAAVPWPNRTWTFAPLGYRPVGEAGVSAIVPTYAPGLPMLMAAAKWIGGHCAVFFVVPISAGLLVLATFGLGRRLAGSWPGVVAAWLVATSPTVVFMLMWPMSDIPVAACWTGAFFFALGFRRREIVAAGVCTAIAILIRPNLAFGAVAIAGWYLWRRRRWADAVLFAIAAAPGALITAAVNQHLYGSPFASGYGDLGAYFSAAHVLPNAGRYLSWFVETQTVVPLVGLVALVWPSRRVWPGPLDHRARWIALGFVTALIVQYLFYLVFEEWWYLRFLLPAWPFIMVGTAAVAVSLMTRERRFRGAVVAAAIVLLGVVNLRHAFADTFFDLRPGEHRYAAVGRLVQSFTDANSVILSMQHSGTVRYYGGRMSLRFDYLERGWLDRAVTWLEGRGVRVYVLLDSWEEPAFRRKFAGEARVAHLDRSPVFKYDGPMVVTLYDVTVARSPHTGDRPIAETFIEPRCTPPAPAPTLTFK